jgi:hypothetical protein
MLRPALLLLTAAATHACSVPVFRYALERWPSDPHPTVLWGADAEQVAQKTPVEAPVIFRAPAAEDAAPSGAQRPWARITFPDGPVWHDGPLPESPRLWTSPARAELVRRIHTGETGIFLVLLSGDATRDQPLLDRLAARQKHLAKIIELPVQESAEDDAPGPGQLRTRAIPLRVAFSTLAIRADDPAETELVAQIRALAAKDAALPLTAPIYGRVRALSVYTAEQVTDRQIDDDCLFLSGSCSCEVKELNPGVDLLVQADWDTLLETPPPGAPGAGKQP